MKRKIKDALLQDWAVQITALRDRLNINQAELARRMECSAMTVSRWERSLLRPSAEHFIQLGNLGNESESWFFWEMAGIQASKMAEALNASSRVRRQFDVRSLQNAQAGPAASVRAPKGSAVVGLPLLKTFIGAHGIPGERHTSLHAIPASKMIGAPASWCPNPAYTSLLRVRGHSMEPLIRHGDILAVDTFQTDRHDLYGKVVVAANEKKGLAVSRLRRYEGIEILEGENREYDPVILNRASGWRIVGKVLWWISVAP